MRFLRLIRIQNLIIVWLSLFLFQCHLFSRSIKQVFFNQGDQLSELNSLQAIFLANEFILLSIIMLIITASGNIINDIYDVNIDAYNNEQNKMIPKYISINHAWTYYFILLFLGGCLSIYVSLSLSKTPLLWLYPVSCLLLYFYSYSWKKRFAIGNITVSVFCASVPWILWLAYKNSIPLADPLDLEQRKLVLVLFSLFIFFITMYREIIKDLEDAEGDRHFGGKTIAIVLGLEKTKIISLFLLLMVPIAGLWYLDKSHVSIISIDTLFFIIFILSPAIYLSTNTFKAKDKQDLHKLSKGAKWYMLCGLLFLIIQIIL